VAGAASITPSPCRQWVAITPSGGGAVYFFASGGEYAAPDAVFRPPAPSRAPAAAPDSILLITWSTDSAALAVATASGSIYLVKRSTVRHTLVLSPVLGLPL
jgi:hypothetical protein